MERWDAEEALRLVEAHGITHTHMVPTMFHRLLSLPDDVRATPRPLVAALGAPRRRAVPGAGEAAHDRVARAGRVGVLRGHRGLGLASSTPRPWLARPGTVGKPADGQVMVGDDEGRAAAARRDRASST